MRWRWRGKSLTYILSSNIPELVPYLAFVLFSNPLILLGIAVALAVLMGIAEEARKAWLRRSLRGWASLAG